MKILSKAQYLTNFLLRTESAYYKQLNTTLTNTSATAVILGSGGNNLQLTLPSGKFFILVGGVFYNSNNGQRTLLSLYRDITTTPVLVENELIDISSQANQRQSPFAGRFITLPTSTTIGIYWRRTNNTSTHISSSLIAFKLED